MLSGFEASSVLALKLSLDAMAEVWHGSVGGELRRGRAAVNCVCRGQEGVIVRSVRYFFSFSKMSSLFALKFRLF